MPTKPVILALLVAIAIVLASTWLLRPPSTSGPIGPQPVLDVDGASIVAFEVRGGETETQRVERGSVGWVYLDGDAPPWAVQASRAQAAARILADLQGRAVSDEAEIGPVEATLVVEDARGRSMSLGLRKPVVGGRRVIDRIDADGTMERFAIDEPLYEAFARTGLAAWRDEGVLGALPGRPARIELARGQSRLELARIGGSWSLRAPIATRASETAMESLLVAIAELRVERFDQLPPPMLSAQDPVTITIEADIVTPSDDGTRHRVVERLTLTLNGAADTGGRLTLVGATRQREHRGAKATTEDLGTTYVAVDLEPLQQATLEPRGYVARTAIDGDASLIASLVLNERTYERTATGWAEAEQEDLPEDRANALDAVATLLAQTPMAGVELTNEPQPLGRASEPVRIDARTIAGEPLVPADGLLLFVVDSPSGTSGVLLIGGGVTREYVDEASLAVGRAALVLARPAPGDQ